MMAHAGDSRFAMPIAPQAFIGTREVRRNPAAAVAIRDRVPQWTQRPPLPRADRDCVRRRQIHGWEMPADAPPVAVKDRPPWPRRTGCLSTSRRVESRPSRY